MMVSNCQKKRPYRVVYRVINSENPFFDFTHSYLTHLYSYFHPGTLQTAKQLNQKCSHPVGLPNRLVQCHFDDKNPTDQCRRWSTALFHPQVVPTLCGCLLPLGRHGGVTILFFTSQMSHCDWCDILVTKNVT